MDTREKNYLLFVPSLLSRATPICYRVGEQEYTGIQTNEAVTKYLIDYLRKKEKQLDKIIMLCTEQVREDKLDIIQGKTTLEYYECEIQRFLEERLGEEYTLREDLFEVIPYVPQGEDEVTEPLQKVLEITQDGKSGLHKHLFIDFTGGIRSAALTLLFTCRILQRSGVEVEKILYSNITGSTKQGTIEECTKTYLLFEYLEGLVEQENGGTEKLTRYVEKTLSEKESESVKKLVCSTDRVNQAKNLNQIGNVVKEAKRVEDDMKKASEEVTSSKGRKLLSVLTGQVNSSEKIIKNTKYAELIVIKEALEKKDYKRAIILFRENMVNILYKAGIVKTCNQYVNKNEKGIDDEKVTNEIMGVYAYYEDPEGNKRRIQKTFMDAVYHYMELLERNPEKDPADVLEQMSSTFFRLDTYADETLRWGFGHNDYSRRTSRKKILPYLEKNYGTTLSADEFIDQYQQMDRLYMGYGFPFACTYGNKYFFDKYDEIYQKNMIRGAKSLHSLFQGKPDERMKRTLNCFPEEDFNYVTLIDALQKKKYAQMLHILFPYELNENKIRSDILKGEAWEEFIYQFAKGFYIVKAVRNKLEHGGKQGKKNLSNEALLAAIEEIQKIFGWLDAHIEWK